MIRTKNKKVASGIAHTAWRGAKRLRPRHFPRPYIFSKRSRRRLRAWRHVRKRTSGRRKLLTSIVRFSGGIFHPCRFKLRAFSTKVPVSIKRNQYVIKTAQTPREVEKVLRLRYSVFYSEYLHKKRLYHIDMDCYDAICDHIMVMDTDNVCVGTYRVLCSKYVNDYYSSNEFDLSAIKKLDDIKVELGRACVHKSYRSSIVLALLWRGLSEYIATSQSRYLFGCSSVKTTDPFEIAIVYVYLMEKYAAPAELLTKPTELYRIENFAEHVEKARKMVKEEIEETAIKLVPPLLSSYLKSGGYVCGEPALDIDFKCVDFLTLMDMHKLSGGMQKKYA